MTFAARTKQPAMGAGGVPDQEGQPSFGAKKKRDGPRMRTVPFSRAPAKKGDTYRKYVSPFFERCPGSRAVYGF